LITFHEYDRINKLLPKGVIRRNKMISLPLVLKLNVGGAPDEWINYEDAAKYYAKELVAWSMAPVDFSLHGGHNALTGEQSILTINTIIAVKGRVSDKRMKKALRVPLINKTLFRRDHMICAYCGDKFSDGHLTRDHVIPRAQKGRDIWTNVVTACKECNQKKDDKTPEQAHMELLYVPYVPNKAEWLILKNRKILTDQMDFLMKSVPPESRLHLL